MEKKKINIKDFLITNNTYVIFLILFIVCAVMSSTFLQPVNLMNICLQQSARSSWRLACCSSS